MCVPILRVTSHLLWQQGTIGFFHPFADAGGGGERVLWVAVAALQRVYPTLKIIIYCGSQDVEPEQLCQKVLDQFALNIRPTFQIVPLPSRNALLPNWYSRLTILRQAAASITVAMQGLRVIVPQIYIDTTGWAFPYPIARFAGAQVAAYVHYPTISRDMLNRLHTTNNILLDSVYVDGLHDPPFIVFKCAKLAYYHILACVYAVCGSAANVVMVNSSWTRERMKAAWWLRRRAPALVYPPCDTHELQELPLDRRLKKVFILSVAQFRPEKDHARQLRAFAAARTKALRMLDDGLAEALLSTKLIMAGSCRGAADEARVAALQSLAEDLDVSKHVEFLLNVSRAELKALLAEAVAGLHTMVDEHFGISVVEFMAAGMIPIAHNSGGPKEDIINIIRSGEEKKKKKKKKEEEEDTINNNYNGTVGFLCSTDDEYTDAIIEVVGMEQSRRLAMAQAARQRAATFSDEKFQAGFLDCISDIL